MSKRRTPSVSVKSIAYKPVILVVVEGDSDQIALEGLFEQMFPNHSLQFVVMDGDVTVPKVNGVYLTGKDIAVHVASQIREKLKNDGRLNLISSCERIIQITDTDGAWVDDAYVKIVKANESIEQKFRIYSGEYILTCDSNEQTRIRNRNRQKKTNLYQLWMTPTMTLRMKTHSSGKQRKGASAKNKTSPPTSLKVDYNLFYMSSNLEHVLHNDPNIVDRGEKKRRAKEWAALTYGDRSIVSSSFSLPDYQEEMFQQQKEYPMRPEAENAYRASWEYITKDQRSISSQTNIGLLFSKE